jgi:hypothetical protein
MMGGHGIDIISSGTSFTKDFGNANASGIMSLRFDWDSLPCADDITPFSAVLVVYSSKK